MPAKSKAQQAAAAIALSVKRGKKPKSALKGASESMYKMTSKQLRDFAKTKTKKLPHKKTTRESYDELRALLIEKVGEESTNFLFEHMGPFKPEYKSSYPSLAGDLTKDVEAKIKKIVEYLDADDLAKIVELINNIYNERLKEETSRVSSATETQTAESYSFDGSGEIIKESNFNIVTLFKQIKEDRSASEKQNHIATDERTGKSIDKKISETNGDTLPCPKCGTNYTAGLKCPKCHPPGKYKGKGGESIMVKSGPEPMSEELSGGGKICKICGEKVNRDSCETPDCPNNRNGNDEDKETIYKEELCKKFWDLIVEAVEITPELQAKMAAGRQKYKEDIRYARGLDLAKTMISIAKRKLGRDLTSADESRLRLWDSRYRYSRNAKKYVDQIEKQSGMDFEDYVVQFVQKAQRSGLEKRKAQKAKELELGYAPEMKPTGAETAETNVETAETLTPEIKESIHDFMMAGALVLEELSKRNNVVKENKMKKFEIITESARGNYTRRMKRLCEVASGNRILTEAEWKDRIGDDNFTLATKMEVLRPLMEQPMPPDTGEDSMIGPPGFGGDKPTPKAGLEDEVEPDEAGEAEEIEDEAGEEIEDEEVITKDEMTKIFNALKMKADDDAKALIDKALMDEMTEEIPEGPPEEGEEEEGEEEEEEEGEEEEKKGKPFGESVEGNLDPAIQARNKEISDDLDELGGWTVDPKTNEWGWEGEGEPDMAILKKYIAKHPNSPRKWRKAPLSRSRGPLP